jgi:hypothetical protein
LEELDECSLECSRRLAERELERVRPSHGSNGAVVGQDRSLASGGNQIRSCPAAQILQPAITVIRGCEPRSGSLLVGVPM